MAKGKEDDRKSGTKGSGGNFKDDPKRAAEAGKKGGEASHGGRGKETDAKSSGKGGR